MAIDRSSYISQIIRYFRSHKVVAIIGPRQCGKTTLSRIFESDSELAVTRFDLEDPTDEYRLVEDPKLALQDLRGLVIIDEIQKAPQLFPILRVIVDNPDSDTKFLVLGSASRDLVNRSSETLAGRIGFVELFPFSLAEVKQDNNLWLRGGFPRSYLLSSDEDSFDWRKNYISTFLERDIPNLGISIPPQTLRRFWMMLAHCHAQTLNYSELGRSFGIADTTVKKYLDILTATFMIRQLAPWYENIAKRQVKSPKLYFRDSGLYHWFLGVKNTKEISSHPRLGASWEGFAIEEVIKFYKADENEAYFWATQTQAELDLLIIKDGGKMGFEMKYSSTPKITSSMKQAIEDLNLDSIKIIFPGNKSFLLSEKVEAIGLNKLTSSEV